MKGFDRIDQKKKLREEGKRDKNKEADVMGGASVSDLTCIRAMTPHQLIEAEIRRFEDLV